MTHAGCRALYPTLRNKTDELIRELAERGGVMGVYNMSLWTTWGRWAASTTSPSAATVRCSGGEAAGRGYKEEAIEKFLGGNFARVFGAAVG